VTRADIAAALRALLPQMHEDAKIHRTWTTPEAQKDLEDKDLVKRVGDVKWHTRWAEYYERCAGTMAAAADELERAA
jgi:hypothetical protein